MTIYYNQSLNKYYYPGSRLTINLNNKLFSGVPTVDQLMDFGFIAIEREEPYINPEVENIKIRMNEIISELASTDYLAIKYIEGEDMSDHPNWKESRHSLREEYNQLESQLNELESV